MFKQIKTKHIENKTYFNCGKTDHIARNCWNGKGQQRGSDSKMQMTATKQKAYNTTDLNKRPTFGRPTQEQNTHLKYQEQMQLYAIKWKSPKRELLPDGRTQRRQPPMSPLSAKSILSTKESHLRYSKNYNEYQYNHEKEENHLYVKWTLQPELNKNCDVCKQ